MNSETDVTSSWPAYARRVIERAVSAADTRSVPPPANATQSHGGAFVTLRKFRHLRGCMGTLNPEESLADAVRQAAVSAALHDPRFPAVTAGELADLRIEVSVLSSPWPMGHLAELELGRHGILIRRQNKRGLFLPQVATEHRLDKETFLSRCCSEKAGLPADAWRDADTEVLLFSADVYAEDE